MTGLAEIHAAALRSLPPEATLFLESGAGTEQTLRANREAFARWVVRPGPMGARAPRTGTELLGIPLAAPILTAPHAQHRHGQCPCAISGTWETSGCACVCAHVEA